jgi:furin
MQVKHFALSTAILALILMGLAISLHHINPQRSHEWSQPIVSINDETRETDLWVVHLARNVSIREMEELHGYIHVKHLGMGAPEGSSRRDMHLFKDPGSRTEKHHGWDHAIGNKKALFAEKQVARKRYTRGELGGGRRDSGAQWSEPTDPLFSKQWHLQDSGVEAAWTVFGIGSETVVSGRGVQICIVDDGLQHSHADISAHYDPLGSWDINLDRSDPSPYTYDTHGTQAAGVAGAIGENGECGVGAAPNAYLAGIRLIAEPATDHEESLALSYAMDRNDIYSCSWGPTDDGRRLEKPGYITSLAMDDALGHGRGGLGSIFIWAAGNGAQSNDRCDYDGYASKRGVNAIGAIGHNGIAPWYSEPCGALLACTPSSDSSHSISTCTRVGCSSNFGGTSAAAPLAAGIAALVLEVNPDLGWRDVQGVIVYSSEKVDSSHQTWKMNGAGLWVSEQYGFGSLNATKAVETALVWSNYPVVEKKEVVDSMYGNSGIATDYSGVISASLVSKSQFYIEHVVLHMEMGCSDRGKWFVELVSPQGTTTTFMEPHSDRAPDIVWTFQTPHLWDELSRGTWTLRLKHADGRMQSVSNKLEKWSISLFGHE